MSLFEKNDLLFAHIALNLADGLSANTRRVAGALLWHFNRKTGQCNPSVERLSKKLGIGRATVLRATDLLSSDEVAMFIKLSHGGKNHTASYIPQWGVFRNIVADWEASTKPKKPAVNVSEMIPSQSHSCDVKGLRNETQTNRRNQLKEPIATVPVETQVKSRPDAAREQPLQGLGKNGQGARHSHNRLSPFGGKQASHSAAAMSAAERRWYRDLKRMDSAVAMQIELLLGDRAGLYEQATQAEFQKKGTGLRFVLDALGNDLLLQS